MVMDDNDEEMGSCDVCDEPHENGNAIDHCAVCGNCWLHCSCTPKRTLEDNLPPLNA